ncbi:MAG: hypothetical protein FWD71_14055 [Oscillospiraceae bacterium]|nr:hypothetical protein [Oscillospiraceae bacterium]
MKLYNIKNAAESAANNYLRFNDENLHNIPYFYAFFGSGGAVAHHDQWDFGDATGRYLDALVLCRKAMGENTPCETEDKYYRALKWMISLGKNGLCYRPDGYDFVSGGVNTFDIRSALLGLITYYNSVKNGEVLEVIKTMIRGLVSIGIDIDDYFYIPVAYYDPHMVIEHRHYDIVSNKADPCHYGGGVHIFPLMMCYEILKDDKILVLCGKLVNFIIKYSGAFEEDGSFFVTGHFAGEDGHFHSRMSTVLGILCYAVKTDDKDMAAWCEKAYRFAKSQGTSYGFFPEGLGKKPLHNVPGEYPDVARHTEICCTADMINIAILLSENGYDYYNDAERFANQLFKSQLNDISDINYFKDISRKKDDTASCSYKNVAERYSGAFLGRTMANDLLNNGRYDNMGCCAAAGGRGIWTLWNYALTQKDGTAFLNLWFDVENDTGTVKITENDGLFTLTVLLKTKTDYELKIRIPERIDIKSIIFNKNTAEITYEMKNEVTTEMLCGEPLTVTWRGNYVVDISPKGIIPLYDNTNKSKGAL